MRGSREGERGCTGGVQQDACDVPAPEQRCQLPCRVSRHCAEVPDAMNRCQAPCRCASHCAAVPDAMQMCQPMCRCAGCCAGCQLLCKCARYHADVPAAVQMCKTSCRGASPPSPQPWLRWQVPLLAVMGMACGDVGCSKKMLVFPPLHHGCQGPAAVPASPGHVLLHFCSDFAKNPLLMGGEIGLLCCLAQFLIVFSTMIFLSFKETSFLLLLFLSHPLPTPPIG